MFNLMVTAVIISLCPSLITAGHSFSGNESTTNVVDYYIQHSFGMMDGFQCHVKTMYLGSTLGQSNSSEMQPSPENILGFATQPGELTADGGPRLHFNESPWS